MLVSVLNVNSEENSQMQINCIDKLQSIFIEDLIRDLVIENYFFLGVRGNYENKKNYSLFFKFNYLDYLFEFDLAYDQLEYYITKNGIVIKECNLEDFWEENIMIQKFVNYLKRDLGLLKITVNFGNVSIVWFLFLELKDMDNQCLLNKFYFKGMSIVLIPFIFKV